MLYYDEGRWIGQFSILKHIHCVFHKENIKAYKEEMNDHLRCIRDFD